MKIKEKLNKIRDFFSDTKLGNCLLGVFVCIYIIGIIVILDNKEEYAVQKIESNPQTSQGINREEFWAKIKKAESEEVPHISKDPTEEEVYNNEYVKHIRNGLNGYLAETNTGVEEFAIEKSNLDSSAICGLKSFDKTYYKSKFIVIAASDADYGGVQAQIFFIDKPDILFTVWVYKLGDDGYVLRSFCKEEMPKDMEAVFPSFVESMIKNSKYSL